MRKFPLIILFVQALGYGAVDCDAPPEAVAKVTAYARYESGIGFWRPGLKRFSFAKDDGDSLFLQEELPQYYDKTLRFVYAYRKGSRLVVAGCPANTEWAKCAKGHLLESIHEPTSSADHKITATCDLSIVIPVWHPSPNSLLKRRLGSEVLHELLEYGYVNPREVYVRDFNVGDPELEFFIVDEDGKDNLQGCTFDVDIQPHCAWHLFGMSPREKVKHGIMARPYKLLPPPSRRGK